MRKPFEQDFKLTQGFGENPDMYARFGMKGHNGLDYGLPTGTQVLAPHLGKVIEAKSDPTGYGNYLKIENEQEGSVLAHLKAFNVAVGDSVVEGQVVGISNNTGNSTGPHLHWGYYTLPRDRANGYAGFINQLPLLVVNDTQSIIDGLRVERDNNWNLYQNELVKNNQLSEQLKTEQDRSQSLREALDKQTEADANLGVDLLDTQHELDISHGEIEEIKSLLDLTYDKDIKDIKEAIKALKKPKEEVINYYQKILDDFWANLRRGKKRSLIDKIWEWFR